MSEVLTERFEMRLAIGHYNRLVVIGLRKGLSSKAEAVRYLIDREYEEIVKGDKNAGK